MPKCNEQKKEELKQYLKSAYEDEKPFRNPLNPHSYHIKAMLADMEVRFAIMYEIARRLNLSILEVAQKYNLINYSLSTHKLAVVYKGRLVNMVITIDAIVSKLLHEASYGSPTIILLNISGSHWVPVIINQNLDNNQLSVLTINSTLDPILHTSELKNFVKAIVDKSKELGLTVTQADESREVQIANVCGLASAHACGVVMTCLQSNLPVRITLLNAEADRLKSDADSSETSRMISYCIQGRRTFAVLEYLYHNFEGVGTNIHIVERKALAKCGLLTDVQASNMRLKVDYHLAKQEELRLSKPTENKVESTKTVTKRVLCKSELKDNYPTTHYKDKELKRRKVAINLQITSESAEPGLLPESTNQELSSTSGEEAFLKGIASSKDPCLVKKYIIAGGDVNASTVRGVTALMLAISARQELYYAPLIDAGAALDVKDMYGRTALGISIAQQNQPAIKILLLNSASVQKEHFTLPPQNWVSKVLISFSLWSPPELSEVNTTLLAYKTDSLKWLKDNGATDKQVEKYHQQSTKPHTNFFERIMCMRA